MFKLFKKNTTNIKPVKCPLCNNTISEDNDYWVCDNKKCSFKIKNVLNGEKIDISLLANLQSLRMYNVMLRYIKEDAKKVGEKYKREAEEKKGL